MRDLKFFIFFIFVFSSSLLICGISMSAPVGNPAGPVLLDGNYPTTFSLEAETVFERNLKASSSGTTRFKGTFYTGKVSFYLGSRFDLYGLVGSYDGRVKEFPNSDHEIITKADIVYGVGASYVLYEREFFGGLLRLGADAKYRQCEPDIDTVKEYREKVVTTNNALSFKEWQASLGLAYQYKRFIPYIGMKYSDIGIHTKFTQDTVTYSDNAIRSKDIWGLFYGIDVLVADNVSFNMELRYIDETALNVGINARF